MTATVPSCHTRHEPEGRRQAGTRDDAGPPKGDRDVATTHKTLRGSCPLVLTPFTDNEDLDLDALKLHIDWLIDKGAPGLFLAGSWGEYSQLSDEERRQGFETGLEHVRGGGAVFVGDCRLGA